MKETDIITNQFGLEFEVEKELINGIWMIDEYNTAKCLLYKDRRSLLPFEQEQKEISVIIFQLNQNA
jgi:hypothetical protein